MRVESLKTSLDAIRAHIHLPHVHVLDVSTCLESVDPIHHGYLDSVCVTSVGVRFFIWLQWSFVVSRTKLPSRNHKTTSPELS